MNDYVGATGIERPSWNSEDPYEMLDVRHAPAMPPLGPSYTVRRTELLRDMMVSGAEAGVVLVRAPAGFGKTALLLQYVQEVLGDPARGSAKLIDAERLPTDELLARIDHAISSMPPATRPLVAIDNMPSYEAGDLERFAQHLRAYKADGCEIVVACTPSQATLVRHMGDSMKIGAQALKVKPKEYADWVRTFSISNDLDVYGLTQGIPELVAALHAATSTPDTMNDLLESAVLKVYRAALADMRSSDERVYRTACTMVLFGEGTLAELDRAGHLPAPEVILTLSHDYPMFGIEPATQRFHCLGEDGGARAALREEIVHELPVLAARTARTLMRLGRVDTVALLLAHAPTSDLAISLVARFPSSFVMAGHTDMVEQVLAQAGRADEAWQPHTGLALATYMLAAATGDIKRARPAAIHLRSCAQAVAQEIDATEWELARAFSAACMESAGVSLPQMPPDTVPEEPSESIRLLDGCARMFDEGHIALPDELAEVPELDVAARRIDVPRLLAHAAAMIAEVLLGIFDAPDARDEVLEGLVPELRVRRLVPVLMAVRTAVSLRRLVAGKPVVDERAFVDSGTYAIRLAHQPLQLLSMVLEGWQALTVGQLATAQFRGQQVARLATDEDELLSVWGTLLEHVAHLKHASRFALNEEAELVTLAPGPCTALEAWHVALSLSAARFDAELAAWYSLHKEQLLERAYRPIARVACQVLGERAASLLHLLPAHVRGYLVGAGAHEPAGRALTIVETPAAAPLARADIGQIDIRLFGGMRVERNGHVLTETLWRRKKTSVLAARLVLALGAFVSRSVLIEEFWPTCEYKRGRSCLYTTLSDLRRVMGQCKGGPQYIIAQGEGIAVNAEYVVSDVMAFDMLARRILLRRANTAPDQVVEACLAMEQIYVGPLYVPDKDSPVFFMRMRRMLEGKFIDCMMRGVEVALEEDDLTSATWLVEAALRQTPAREDVVRAAMRVYHASGRRREVVDIYQGHLHLLEQQAQVMPEPETRQLYAELIQSSRRVGIMHG